eukprot:TRINITY_DN6337_c0_g1_i1.p1 TRINITY_DN6337_c0_g1~~TRINITY_DN6337_c0_g1_i1.p1  ORF type:complete len:391 (-),score=111.01 TRINITY_DN6337_c0_g1_i1:146-1318(-)
MTIRPVIFILALGLLLSHSPTADAHWTIDWVQDKVQHIGNTFHDLIASCPIREGYKDTLRGGLEKQIFGQELAINRIVSGVQAHPAGKPLSFHFVGDNGTGKTKTAKILAELKFTKRDQDNIPRGLLYLRGNHFRIGEQLLSAGELKLQSNNASAAQNSTQENQSSLSRLRTLIREQLLTQLALCPESVIIIDEFELFHRRTVTVFQEFLDATYPVITYNNLKARLDKATYIFISDFGTAGMTSQMSLAEIHALVVAECARAWQDSKLTALLSHVVPFHPLSRAGLVDFTQHLLTALTAHPRLAEARVKVSSVSVQSQQAFDRLIDTLWQASQSPPLIGWNYRGVEQLFESLVTEPFLASVQDQTDHVLNVALVNSKTGWDFQATHVSEK